MAQTLLEETLELARASTMPRSKICRDCGFSLVWYHQLLLGRYDDPGVKKIDRLNKYLKAEKVMQEKVQEIQKAFEK